LAIIFRAMDSVPYEHPQSTGERAVPSPKDEIIKEAKRVEEDALHSSKGHFAAAQLWGRFHLWTGILISVLSGFSAGFIFADSYRLAAGILASVVVMLSAVATFLNPNERASTHLSAGNNYDALCTRSRIFWTIECWREEYTDQVLTEKLRDLCDEKNKLNHSCPQIPKWAYDEAKKGIDAGEGVYQVDKRA
jgi:hypothetical protein